MGGPSQPPSSPLGTAATPGDGLIPVAAYVRMSTEHQQYSTENQLDRIKEYAARRGMVNRTFARRRVLQLADRKRRRLDVQVNAVEQRAADARSVFDYL